MSIDETRKMFNRFKARKCSNAEEKAVRYAINHLQHERNGVILILHYQKGQTWQSIADEVPADISTIFRWNRALMYKASRLIGTKKGGVKWKKN